MMANRLPGVRNVDDSLSKNDNRAQSIPNAIVYCRTASGEQLAESLCLGQADQRLILERNKTIERKGSHT